MPARGRRAWLWALAAGWAGVLPGDPLPPGEVPEAPSEEAADPAPALREASRMDVVENFRVPLEKHANGRVKTLLHARRAGMRPEGVIAADHVRIEWYDAEGTLTGVVRADDAVVDQARRSGVGKGRVRLERQGLVIRGVGLTWTGAENLVRIEAEAEVELDRFGRTLVEGWR